jgi:hypothetical protein
MVVVTVGDVAKAFALVTSIADIQAGAIGSYPAHNVCGVRAHHA